MPPELSSPAKDLISQLLQKNPQKRMTLQEIRNHPFISDKYVSSGQVIILFILYCNFLDSSLLQNGYRNGFLVIADSIRAPYLAIICPRDSIPWSESQPLGNPMDMVPSILPNHQKGAGSYLLQSSLPTLNPKCNTFNSCRSQDTRLNPDLNGYHSDMMQLMSENDFFANHDFHDRVERDYDSSFTKKLTNNMEFSPVQRRAVDPAKRCEVFYENEFLNRAGCNCSKCNSNRSCEKAKPAGYKADAKSKTRADGSVRKIVFSANEKAESHPAAGTEFSSESDDSEERVKVTPFTTERLKSTRHRLRNTVFSILENGDVCVEFLRSKSKSKEIITEVVRISKNGLKV